MFNMPDCQDQLPIVHQQLGRPARKESGASVAGLPLAASTIVRS
jgi:hypothetical protein